jgi:hypothetical protein
VVTVCVVGVTVALVSDNDECALPRGSGRHLDPHDSHDMKHLASDLAVARETAARYRRFVRTLPVERSSVHARQSAATRPDRAYQYCLAILTDEIARIHGMDLASSAAR